MEKALTVLGNCQGFVFSGTEAPFVEGRSGAQT
jgi:hypothetical protein